MGLTARDDDGFRVGEDGTAGAAAGVQHRRAGPPTTTLELMGGDLPPVLLKPLERSLIQRQQSADHGSIVSPVSDTSEIASIMDRAVHFLPPGNTASSAYDWGHPAARRPRDPPGQQDAGRLQGPRQDLRPPRRQLVHDRHGRHDADAVSRQEQHRQRALGAYPPPRSWAGGLTSYADRLFFRQ